MADSGRFSLALLVVAGSLWAQHSYTPADVEEGGKLFRADCVGCHGATGDLVPVAGRQYVAVAAGSSLYVYALREGR